MDLGADPSQITMMRVPNREIEIAFADKADQEEVVSAVKSQQEVVAASTNCCSSSDIRWYFEVKPGFYYFTKQTMRQFYGDGGFTIRAELAYKAYGPLFAYLDGGYFQKDGKAIGTLLNTNIKIGTITMGIKGVYSPFDAVSLYAGLGPRLFMLMVDNDSPFVRGDDNAFGIGGGFAAGAWVYPLPSYRNFFLDLFVDYSWKKLKIDEDEISSYDYDIDISGVSVGAGLGLKF
jgi:hypothetical protein